GLTKIHPRHALKENWKSGFFAAVVQYYRNHRCPTINKFPKKCLQLHVLPGTEAVLSDEDRGRSDLTDLLFKRALPGQPRTKLLFVEPGQQSPLFQSSTHLADLGLIGGTMTEEDVEVIGGDLLLKNCRSFCRVRAQRTRVHPDMDVRSSGSRDRLPPVSGFHRSLAPMGPCRLDNSCSPDVGELCRLPVIPLDKSVSRQFPGEQLIEHHS